MRRTRSARSKEENTEKEIGGKLQMNEDVCGEGIGMIIALDMR